MHEAIKTYNKTQSDVHQKIVEVLANTIDEQLPEAASKIWHAHPVWFIQENPIVGYSILKAGVRLMFWSGESFEAEQLKPGSGKFKDASILFTAVEEINVDDLISWLKLSKTIQWDYKNIVKRKGLLIRL